MAARETVAAVKMREGRKSWDSSNSGNTEKGDAPQGKPY